MNSIDLNELFKNVFGIPLPEYKLYAEEYRQPVDASGNLNGLFGSPKYGANMVNGSYYFMPVFFDTNQNNQLDDSDYELPFPVIRIQSQKRIVETPLTERKGTVLELVNQDSWKIYIKGFIIAKDNEYPEAEILALKNLYEIYTAISIRSVLTDLFLQASDKVVIKSLNFPDVTGVETVKPYEMELISCNVLSLEV